ncbi:MAG: hypothetical protein ACKVT2_05045 [Saprospiraceae bacterium]
MTKIKTGIIPYNILETRNNFPQYATFLISQFSDLLAQTNCQGIRLFPASVNSNSLPSGNPYKSVMALGYDTAGHNIADIILLDTQPCPPECHITGITNVNSSFPDDIHQINLEDAQNLLTPASFSAQFHKIEDFAILFSLPGAYKLRIFFALIPNSVAEPQSTFVMQAVYQNGDAINNVYLQDDNPMAGTL